MKKVIGLLALSLIYFTSSAQLYQEYLLSDWVFKSTNDKFWLPAEVPGISIDDLLLNGKTTVETADTTWQYQTTFVVDKHVLSRDFVELVFEGLDTRATVYLNQKKILDADNMFRSWTVPIKALAKEGENELLIQFSTDDYSPSLRKALYHYGNESPLIPVGVWKPVILESWNEFRLDDVHFAVSDLTEKNKEAHLLASIDFRVEDDLSLDIEVYDEVSGKIYAREKQVVSKDRQHLNIPFVIRKPKLWWPASLGRPNLYKLGVRVKRGDNEQTLGKRIGIREVSIDSASTRENMRLRVNGKPVKVEKTDYQPCVYNVSNQSTSDYEGIFTIVESLGKTMIEVSSVGVYENDYFYDLADVRGVLILQDFMFPPAVYPKSEDFLTNVKLEAEENIKALQHHPSIVAWSGVQVERQDVEVEAKHINQVLEKVLKQIDSTYHFIAR